ncbi:uncharacterized protein LOC141655522 [Silene latifolia]|uniref:uncharacterized protein LOC141655522 n=1 Tax=Silene latifolia TaxID=37657 RepID=UPI003D7863A9
MNNVGLFGLSETRVKSINVNKVQQGLGSHWQFLNNNDILDRVGFTPWFMAVIKTVKGLISGALQRLKQSLVDPWIIMGDFNNVLHSDERIGSPITQAEVQGFQECVDDCGLYDVVTSGTFFTWNNKQEGVARVFSRIDRVMVNDQWILQGPSGTVTFLPEGLYDHSPCLMELWHSFPRQKSRFMYFNMWGKDDQFLSIVQQVWGTSISGCLSYQVARKLKLLKGPLKKLNREGYGDIVTSAQVAKMFLEDIQGKLHQDPTNFLLMAEERIASKSYKDLEAAKTSYLAQKAKALSLNNADENTHYFHSTIKARRAMNKVLSIQDVNGRCVVKRYH